MDDRELQIRTGQAVNLAYHYAFLSGAVTNIEDATELVKEIVPHLVESINSIQAQMAFAHAAATPAQPQPRPLTAPPAPPQAQAAPPPAQGNVVPFPAQQQVYNPQYGHAPQAPQPAPPIPGATGSQPGNSKTDQAWLDYFANPGKYWDNRLSKKSPSGPDFKHKDTGQGLWLNGKYPAPQWVTERLNQDSF